MNSIPFVTASNLSRYAVISHGFFGRRGGVSQGLYASLNVGAGSEDAASHVIENRENVRNALRASALATLYQVHSARAVTVDAPIPMEARPEADAAATRTPGLALGILTADCTPILFADPKEGVIAAAHGGWKGTLNGIVENTITAMESLGARRETILAAIGPTIAQASYEVGADLRQAFLDRDAAAAGLFVPSARHGHYMFDLPGAVAARLAAAEIRDVRRLDLDTYALEADYFSYRRATHRGEPDYGRQIAAIALRD